MRFPTSIQSVRPFLRLMVALLVAPCLNSCARQEEPAPEAKPAPQDESIAIRDVLKKGLTAARRGEVAEVLACYSEDVSYFPQGRVPVRGKAELQKVFEEFAKAHRVDISYSVQEVAVLGAEAFERGAFVATLREGEKAVLSVPGNAMHKFVKDAAGNWVISAEIWNLTPLDE